ncbi:hypothetical protein ACN27G_36835 [Plantactinospora sp. WMMB334]
MNTPEMRPNDVRTDEARATEVLRMLSGTPVGLDVAVKSSRPPEPTRAP